MICSMLSFNVSEMSGNSTSPYKFQYLVLRLPVKFRIVDQFILLVTCVTKRRKRSSLTSLSTPKLGIKREGDGKLTKYHGHTSFQIVLYRPNYVYDYTAVTKP